MSGFDQSLFTPVEYVPDLVLVDIPPTQYSGKLPPAKLKFVRSLLPLSNPPVMSKVDPAKMERSVTISAPTVWLEPANDKVACTPALLDLRNAGEAHARPLLDKVPLMTFVAVVEVLKVVEAPNETLFTEIALVAASKINSEVPAKVIVPEPAPTVPTLPLPIFKIVVPLRLISLFA